MLKKGEIKMIKKFLAEGFSKSAIARKLGISRETVRRYANLPDDYIPHINRPLVINSVDPYLSKRELSNYLKVSESFIKQKLYSGEFVENLHFFKIGDAKIIFDRLEIDKWIRVQAIEGDNNGKPIPKGREALSKYLSQWKESHTSNGA